ILDRQVLRVAFAELDVRRRIAEVRHHDRRVAPGHREHLVGHVHTDHPAGRADAPGSLKAIDTPARADVQHRLARPHRRQAGRRDRYTSKSPLVLILTVAPSSRISNQRVFFYNEALMSERFDRVVQIMSRLRGEGGCPWDRKQTRESLKPYLVEEAYEVLETIEKQDEAKLKEELGDVLLQVLFHAQIGRERKTFTIEDVLETLAEKLIRRHPHVFGE